MVEASFSDISTSFLKSSQGKRLEAMDFGYLATSKAAGIINEVISFHKAYKSVSSNIKAEKCKNRSKRLRIRKSRISRSRIRKSKIEIRFEFKFRSL